jgi:hypothetical protein
MKILELSFLTEEGKTARISIDNPEEPVDTEQVKLAMEEIIEAGVFIDSEGNPYAAAKEAKLIERNVTVYEID